MPAKHAGEKPRGRKRRILGAAAVAALTPLLVLQFLILRLSRDGGVVELPEFFSEALRERLAQSGIAAEWRSATADLSGRIELTRAKIGAPGAENFFSARRVIAEIDAFDLLTRGKVTPMRLGIHDGKLTCPAPLSPTGREEVTLDNIRAELHREGDRLYADTLRAKCFGIPLIARGRLIPPGKTTRGGAQSEAPLRGVIIAARQLILLRPALNRLESPSLELTGTDTGTGVVLALNAGAERARFGDSDISGMRLKIAATWDTDGLPKPSGNALFILDSARVSLPKSGATPAILAKTGRVALSTSFGPDWSPPTHAEAVAHDAVVNEFALDRLAVSFDRSASPVLKIDIDALAGEDSSEAKIVTDTRDGATSASFSGRVRQSTVMRHAAAFVKPPDILKKLRVGDFADLSGDLSLGPGRAFRNATLSLETGDTTFDTIALSSLRANARITRDDFSVSELDAIARDGRRIRGAISFGFLDDSPYRVLLRGEAYPQEVAPFVGDWWTRIWSHVALAPGVPAAADIDVAGQISGRRDEFIHGSVSALGLSYAGVSFDRAALRIFEKPDRIVLGDLSLKKNDGSEAGGQIEWVRSPQGLDSTRFRFSGRLPLDTGLKLAGPETQKALEGLSVDGQAKATVIGRYDGDAGPNPGRDRLEVRVSDVKSFSYKKISGKDFRGVVTMDGDRFRVKETSFLFAGGPVKADAWVLRIGDISRVTADASFTDLDRETCLEALRALNPPTPDAKPKTKPPKTKDDAIAPATLSGRFRARVALPDFDTLDATGALTTKDAAMLRLPIFGIVSRAFSGVGIGLGDFRFNSASTDFTVRRGAVYFPNLVISGPDAKIDIAGNYDYRADKLAMRALLDPNETDSLLGVISGSMNRVTKLFPVDIHGTLDEPEWSLDPNLGAIFSKPKPSTLGIAPAEPEDDGLR